MLLEFMLMIVVVNKGYQHDLDQVVMNRNYGRFVGTQRLQHIRADRSIKVRVHPSVHHGLHSNVRILPGWGFSLLVTHSAIYSLRIGTSNFCR